MDISLYQTIEAYMISGMADSAHDTQHVYRVLYNALDISSAIAEEMSRIAAAERDVDRDVLIAACLLHDVGRAEQFRDPSVCHAREGGVMAAAFLKSIGFGDDRAEHAAACISTHRFRGDNPPASLEAKILFDADKLEAAGVIGIARTLVYQGLVAEPLYAVSEDGRLLEGDGGESPSFFREYRFKLARVYDAFYTARGREMALSRRSAAEAFHEALRRETGDTLEKGRRLLDAALSG